MNAPIRVVIADDYRGIRTAIRTTTALHPRIEVVGEAASGVEAMELCRAHAPDVLLLDLGMPGPPADAIARTLKATVPHLRVLVLSASRYPGGMSSMAAARIDGYLAKHRAPEELIPAILAVAGGGTWYADRVVTVGTAAHLSAPSEGIPLATLSPAQERALDDLGRDLGALFPECEVVAREAQAGTQVHVEVKERKNGRILGQGRYSADQLERNWRAMRNTLIWRVRRSIA